MKRKILKITVLNLLAAALVAMPALSHAQDATSTNATDQTTGAPAKHKKHGGLVFHGKLSGIDTNAMTFTVGTKTFEVTSDTKITKDGQPATLADGMVGEMAGGAYKKGEDGKLTATTVHFGEKAGGKKKKKANPDSTDTSTNSAGM